MLPNTSLNKFLIKKIVTENFLKLVSYKKIRNKILESITVRFKVITGCKI